MSIMQAFALLANTTELLQLLRFFKLWNTRKCGIKQIDC